MADVWLALSESERLLLHEALATYRGAEGANGDDVNAFALRLVEAIPCPLITVGVYGGQVQWTSGNPFPIRICDYDGDKADLPCVDERGERCRIWFEPSDDEARDTRTKRHA